MKRNSQMRGDSLKSSEERHSKMIPSISRNNLPGQIMLKIICLTPGSLYILLFIAFQQVSAYLYF